MKYFWLTIKKMFRFLLKPLSFVPALCVMYMIFSFSAQTADESGQLSMLVSEKVVLLLGKLTSGNLDTAQVGVYADEIHFLVRKMAHFSEYLLLGLLFPDPDPACFPETALCRSFQIRWASPGYLVLLPQTKGFQTSSRTALLPPASTRSL